MWLYKFKSQFVNVAKKNGHKGYDYKGGFLYVQNNENLLNLTTKCRVLAFNAQSSKVIIIVVHVGIEFQHLMHKVWE
jgi:hypothetical protein